MAPWHAPSSHLAKSAVSGYAQYSCRFIRNHITDTESQIRRLFLNEEPEQLEEMIELLLLACLSLSEMEPNRDFSGNYGELLRQWMGGTDIQDLMREFAEESSSPEEFGRFIDDLLRYTQKRQVMRWNPV